MGFTLHGYFCGAMIKSLPDDELFRKIQLDDQQAFSAIVYRYHVKLYRTIHNRIRERDDTNDILQEVFISLWNNRHQIQSAAAIYPYLSRSAFYAVIDWQLQHKKDIARHHLLLEKDEPLGFSIESQLIANELKRELLAEVEKMPDTTRKVFRMSRIDHKSVKEIAVSLHLSEQTVRNNISMALKQLRTHMVSDKLALVVLSLLMKRMLLILSCLGLLINT